MVTRIVRKSLVAISIAAIVMALANVHRAAATTLTFDGLPNAFIGNSYIEKDYQFSDMIGMSSYGVGSTDPRSVDSSPGSATLFQSGRKPFIYTPTVLTRVGGGAFDLISVDFADEENTDNPFTFQFVFNFADGTTISPLISLDDNWGPQTITFNYTNLLSVEWGNYTGNDPLQLQWDNVRVAATPIPAALPLLAAAMSSLGLVAWRRRKAAAV